MSIASKLIDLGIITVDAPDVSFEELGASGYITHRLTEADVERAWNEKFGEAGSTEATGPEPVADTGGDVSVESVRVETLPTTDGVPETESERTVDGGEPRPTKPKRGKKEESPDLPPPPAPVPGGINDLGENTTV